MGRKSRTKWQGKGWRWAIVALGATLATTGFVYWLTVTAAVRGTSGDSLLTLVLLVAPAVGVAAGGGWLLRGNAASDLDRRIVIWCAGVLVWGALVGVSATIFSEAVWQTTDVIYSAQVAASAGALTGLLIGESEARAIANAREAERAQVTVQHAEAERERLTFLNHLLRHDVNNAINVIEGYLELLIEEHDGETRERLEIVHQRATSVADLIEDVRILLQATSGDDALETTDLAGVLEREVAVLRETYPEAVIDAEIRPTPFVDADELLSSAFHNLLVNAVEHNDAARPHVWVSTDSADGRVRVRIADDGPGIPADVREALFKPSDDGSHGYGLYLVSSLVERYGGTIDLADNEPTGTVFEVTFVCDSDRMTADPVLT